MKRTAKNAKRRRGGFTIPELLITMCFLAIGAQVLGSVMSRAQSMYEDVMDAANAETLLTMTMTKLRGELGIAFIEEVDNDGQYINYISAYNGAPTRIYIGEDKTLMISEYRYKEQEAFWPEPHSLISERTQKKMRVICNSITIDNNVIKIKNLMVLEADEEMPDEEDSSIEDTYFGIRNIVFSAQNH